jgi:hypothetical protein
LQDVQRLEAGYHDRNTVFACKRLRHPHHAKIVG